MLSIERTRQLLNYPTLSDEEVQAVRDNFRLLAEIIFEGPFMKECWQD